MNYYRQLLSGCGKMSSADFVAQMMIEFIRGISVRHLSNNIRGWRVYFYTEGYLLVSWQGKHRKIESLIEDEDVKAQCLAWVRSTKPSHCNAVEFNKFLISDVFPG